jgi:hypothetical protein
VPLGESGVQGPQTGPEIKIVFNSAQIRDDSDEDYLRRLDFKKLADDDIKKILGVYK